MAKQKSKPFVQRHDGEWFRIGRRGHLLACCDCGLVHLITPKIVKGSVWIRATRIPSETGARRRWMRKVKK